MKMSFLARLARPSLLGPLGMCIAMSLLAPSAQADTTVNAGTDYLMTPENGAQFSFVDPLFGPNPVTIDFTGFPFHNPQPATPSPGKADTIVNRTATVVANAAGGVTPIEIVNLSLKSSSPVTISGTSYDLFVGLQKFYPVSLGGGTASTGSMTIRDDGSPLGKTWDSVFDIHAVAVALPLGFLVPEGSNFVNSLIAGCGTTVYTCLSFNKPNFRASFEPWSESASLGQIVGDNLVSNGLAPNFFLTKRVIHDAGGGTIHIVDAPVPLPILGASAGLAFARRLKKAAAMQKRMQISQ
jgi:hypothetical protein